MTPKGGRVRRHLVMLLAVAASVAGVPSIASAPAAKGSPGVVAVGRGDDEVWLMRPQGPVRVIVVFVHGWTNTAPTDWRPWLRHLRARGALVVYPHYQSHSGDSTQAALVHLRHGIVAGFARLRGLHVPVVALGKSFGGAAVFDYAGEARSWGVPAPVAAVGIFPAFFTGPLPPPLGPHVFAEVQVGDADTIAGTGGANEIWHWLGSHPARDKRYVTIHSRTGFTATHQSVQLTTPIARAVFWHPFDVLLARVRAGVTP